MSNPLVELNQSGQSIWFDQMESRLIAEGTLRKMIDEDDLRGLTSNPTIFEKAIGGSSDYDAALADLATRDRNRFEILESLMVGDIGRAADLFRGVYDKTGGVDGMVSIEVSPTLAHDAAGTIDEGKKLFALLDRPNVMIKVPATPEGLVAIEELIYSGINVNITLIFSRDVYAKVIDAYVRGLERRAGEGKPIDRVQSVASFFVSRIDSKVDKELEKKIAEGNESLRPLLGKIAIANAKMAYRLFRERFSDERWMKLAEKGAHVQRPLWASTGTKNPDYSDVLYLEELIGPDTVNTVPPATYSAFRDHGKVRRTIDDGVEEAKRQLAALETAGISLPKITEELTLEGVKSFADSFESLIGTIEARRADVVRSARDIHREKLGGLEAELLAELAKIEKSKLVSRIWKKDASVWKDDAGHQQLISNSLGWLTVARDMRQHVGEIRKFVEEARTEFDQAVVLGMGGSSLVAEVLRTSFGLEAGYPELHVLDSTVPEAISTLEAKLDLERTLFIVASKSGTTTEPSLFYRYFFGRVKEKKGARAGENFIAITDPSTQLESDAKLDRFRKIFTNPADIGGRYSALSLFGLVPAALIGVDLDRWLDRAEEGMALCSTALPASKNRGVRLGAAMGLLASKGRDKVTIVTGDYYRAVGLWIEQLVAESTGKEGKGILPIAQEPLVAPASYGSDRFFVMIRDERTETPRELHALAGAGHPFIERILRDPYDLAAEFFIWEFATAVAATFLGINPFDQPNVQEAKDITRQALEKYRSEKKLSAGEASPSDEVAKTLASLAPGDYVALMAYFGESHERNELLTDLRRRLMEKFRVATTSGYGPRFLHSTGQLHKGGANKGVFIQLTADDKNELPISGEPYSFGVVKSAQAIGDLAALRNKQRRTLRIHLGKDIEGGLKKLTESIS